MVAPWESHRSHPQKWNSDDEFEGGKDTFSYPPAPSDFEDFPTPDIEVDQTGYGYSFDAPIENHEQKKDSGKGGDKPSNPRKYPVALFGVAACAAILVFLGLRLINVSFGSNSDLADGTC